MNLYLLVEGKRTEKKVYPKWLSHLLPKLTKQDSVEKVIHNDYYLFSGDGFPSILTHLENAVEDINEAGIFNYFLVIIDADEDTVENREKEITTYLNKQKVSLNNHTKLVVLVQNRTMETWFLGNQKIFKNNPQNKRLLQYIQHYNVKNNDPELMPVLPKDKRTHAQFHHDYCKAMLKERNISYSKKTPKAVIDKDYLDTLIYRHEQTGHLPSFKNFLIFCQYVALDMVDK